MNILDFTYVPTFDECCRMTRSRKDIFIKKDELIDNKYRIATFSYRLAMIDDFVHFNGSRNMRGITFLTDTKELIALPLHKFWNVNENAYTQIKDVKEKPILRVTEKYDGSLIYFFMIENNLYCKTKMNSFSDQAIWAMELVNNNLKLKTEIINLIKLNLTPIFEFISPRNQIVIFYESESLKYICSRNMFEGTYVFDNILNSEVVDHYDFNNIDRLNEKIKNYEGHEGFVIIFDDHDMVKIKSEDYMDLHKTRSSILNEKSLVKYILNEEIDDIKSNFFTQDSNMIEYINEFQKKVTKRFNIYLSNVNNYYLKNKHLERKDYAILGQKELNRVEFGLAMECYYNGEINMNKFKEIFVNKKLWG